MRHHSITTLITSLSLSWTVFSASGGVLFEDDFEGPPGKDNNPSAEKWSVQEDGRDAMVDVIDDTYGRFTMGSNRYARLLDDSVEAAVQLAPKRQWDPVGVLTVAFDFIEPEREGFSGRFIVRAGEGGMNKSSYSLSNNAGFSEGRVGKVDTDTPHYQLGRKHAARVIFNESGDTVSYGDGLTLENGNVDVWIDGKRVAAGITDYRHWNRPGLRRFGIRTFAPDVQEVWIDNVKVFDEAVAP